MEEIILNMDLFKQQIAYSINNSNLPADIIKYILKDFENTLENLANFQLENAKQNQIKKGKKENGKSED